MIEYDGYDSRDRLDFWCGWLGRNETYMGDAYIDMDRREELYRGDYHTILPLTDRDRQKSGEVNRIVHLRNIVSENIESEISSIIPQPKVTARRKRDEWRAKILEDMLRNELDRLPMEMLNDMQERTVPIQGGAYWMVEWDNDKRSGDYVGDVVVTAVHPKGVVPQYGIFGAVEDMDAIVIKAAQTKDYINRAYGVDVDADLEQEPEVRTINKDAMTAEELVTQYIAYYRNSKGGIGRFSWVCNTVLEDVDDYEARRIRRCKACGEVIDSPRTKSCPKCGSAIPGGSDAEEFEELYEDIRTSNGTVIRALSLDIDPDTGLPAPRPTKLPYYKPDVFPIYLQKNVSVFGQLLGESDVDKIKDQQNTINRLEKKIIDRLVKAGTRITLPDRADFRVDPEDGEKWYIGNAADKNLIDVFQFSGDLHYEMQYLQGVYEEARQILGITDSFQGRKDTTAQSGVAKQFAAAQSAGRLESKRVMKEAAYAELFKRIVQLKVAYADEPRPIVAYDDRGQAQYEEFNRYDFYEQDTLTGEWHCILDDDRFLFSCDVSTPLASNRQQMWQDTTQMFQMGAFGNPAELQTLLLYWTKLELLHYPGASDTKEYLEKLKQEQEAAMAQQQAQEAAMRDAQAMAQQQDTERKAVRDIDAQAREDAWRTAQAMMGRSAIPGAAERPKI